MIKLQTITLCLLAIMSCGNKAEAVDADSNPEILNEILNLKAGMGLKEKKASKVAEVRINAVKDQAFILGSQAGLYWTGTHTQETATKHARNLDRTWRFDALMLYQGHVLPPVVADIRGSQDIEPDVRVTIGRNLMIVKPARFVQHQPTWREYLLDIQFDKPDIESVSPFFLPSPEEVKIWQRSVLSGWKVGAKQAELMMSDGIHRLSRDFNGMIQYHILLSMHMITPPFVSEQRDSVDMTNDGHLNIDKRTQKMTVKPMFNRFDENWVAVPGIKSAFSN